MLHLQLNFKVTCGTKYFYQHVCFVKIKRESDEQRWFEIEVGSFKVYSFLERILMAGL